MGASFCNKECQILSCVVCRVQDVVRVPGIECASDRARTRSAVCRERAGCAHYGSTEQHLHSRVDGRSARLRAAKTGHQRTGARVLDHRSALTIHLFFFQFPFLSFHICLIHTHRERLHSKNKSSQFTQYSPFWGSRRIK